ncbi:alpha/beta hydrolase [Chitinimonas arctica]|uniref:Alpha/beta hydrolase n=1 Tax=Chitinimonas arctica TaxID=2594795 RepID=A0A516SL07_9NEIS|nr:alpha/beta hydrolase [Chitinimonas arctica]QDQ28835.1 alpha/beta hydrolase [Chitinimonas arctica]
MQTQYRPVHPSRSDTLVIRGIEYRIRRWGRRGGRPLLLLHGWMDCAATFQFMIDAAPAELLEYDLIAPDWRGFGASAWAAEGYYFPDYLADLDALLDQLAPERPVDLLGHSMGGMVASLYAGIRPERVARLVSLEGFGLPRTTPEQAPARYLRWLDECKTPPAERPLRGLPELAGRLRKFNPRLSEDKAAWLAAELSAEVDGQLRQLADPRHRWVNPVLYRLEEAMACWRQVQAPVLWLAGDEAKLLGWMGETPEQFALRRDCFTSLCYESLPDCGHNLHHDAPGRVAASVSAFFENAARE